MMDAFQHRFVPAKDASRAWTLLLLHGTGGNEDDLIPLGTALQPDANLLSPRGKVVENGMPRFFRRLAEGVFDQDDLRRRTDELTAFVQTAATEYGFDPARVVAVGYSNGANIAASALLRNPGTLAGAVLLHPMVPFEPETTPDLAGTDLFIAAGRRDAMVPTSNTEALAALFRLAGAAVTLFWHDGGHALARSEVDAAKLWLERKTV